MINLVKSENMKLFHRVSTWVLAGILIFLVLIVGYITKYGPDQDIFKNYNWETRLTEQNNQLEEELKESGISESEKNDDIAVIKINEYRLEHKLPPYTGIWDFVVSNTGTTSFIAFFAIVIGSGIVVNEFSAGTIKLLLIRPSKRWKVLVSKYISTLSLTFMMLVVLFISIFLLGGLLFNFRGMTASYLKYSGGQVHEISFFMHSIRVYLFECVNLIMMATLAFMISTIFRKKILAIGLAVAIFLIFAGNSFAKFISQYSWSKFILFQNTDLSMYINGKPPVEGMTMTFSVVVLLIYFIIFNAISLLIFNKRDVPV